MRPLPIVKGEGVYLTDENGNKYIDAISSWWVNLHGHAHPYVARKIYEQAKTLEHIIFAGFTHRPAVDLAENLIPLLPLFAVPLAFLPPRWAAVGWSLAMISIAQHMIAVAARMDYISQLVRHSLDANHRPTTLFVSTIWSGCGKRVGRSWKHVCGPVAQSPASMVSAWIRAAICL